MYERNISARYLIETSQPLEMAAAMLAGEQSSGTFLPTPGETEELKSKHGATVDSIEEVGVVEKPTLDGARHRKGQPIKRAIIKVSWPLANVGYNLPNLYATVAGNLFELNAFSGVKLLSVTVPPGFAEKYPGPKFGIEGTRRLTSVYERPVIGTIIKPSVGLSPEETAQNVSELIEAGLDFIKDDELMGDPPHSPFTRRVDRVMDVINRYADKTGKKPMYAFNISGDLDDMFDRHDYLLKRGGTCIMMNLNWVGISGVHRLARHTQLPIHGHRNGWGMLTRSEALGMDFAAYQLIWRLAGVDHLHTNGLKNKFCESDESVVRSIRECLSPLHGTTAIMPVVSSGQWAGQTVETYNTVKTVDLMYLCGGGIVGHPSGIRAGVESVKQGWEAALAGVSLEEYAQSHPELKTALAFYGKG